METITCHICSGPAFKRYAGHVGYQNSKRYDIYHCGECTVAFADPLEVDGQIYNHIYSKIDKVCGYHRYFDYANQVFAQENPLEYLAESEDIYWAIQQYLKGRQNLRILEVGCGFGYLTYALAKSGCDVLGIDISKTAVEQAKKRYGDYFKAIGIEAYAQQCQEKYDVVIFTEVIEHIQDVKRFLQAADSLLRPGGDLVMTTPNRTPYPDDVLWDTEPPPVHLWWFSEKSLSYLAQMLGHAISFVDFNPFNIQEVKRHANYTKPHTTIRRFQPTSLPRLDENGDILKTPYAVYISTNRIKEGIKAILKGIGVFGFLRGCKKAFLLAFLRIKPQKRPTLCAIFHKPDKT